MPDPILDLDLNVDIRDVDTTMPRLAPGKYRFEIGELEVGENKAKTGRNLAVQFILKENALSTEGKPINPGFMCFRHYPLQQSDNPKAPDFRRDLVALIDAALRIDKPEDRPKLAEGLGMIQGKEVDCVIAVRPATEQYGETNDVKKVEQALAA